MPSPRPRFRVIKGKFASAYMPKKYTDHTAELVEQIQMIAGQPYDGPLTVDLVFLCTKPKTSKLRHPKPDVDNYAKTTLDAITKAGNIWIDDTQVVQLNVTKLWAADEMEAGTAVMIKPYEVA